MSLKLISYLINHSFGDPGLLVSFIHERRNFLFDLGSLANISIHQIINISHVFITHTHIDHFCGFDKLLRICLGRNKILHFYGPPGLFYNIEGKLAGYHWNLLNNYKKNLILYVTEIHKSHILRRTYQSNNGFVAENLTKFDKNNNIILLKKNFKITAEILNHNTICIAYSFQELPRIKILSEKLKNFNLTPKSWIKDLKNSIYYKLKKKKIRAIDNNNNKVKINISFVKKKIIKITRGEKITYITDINYSSKNKKAIIKLAHKSSHLYIEAAFDSKNRWMAIKKGHLTAKQAGQIAFISKSKKYTLFHHSPRYLNNTEIFNLETKKILKNN